MFRKGNKNRGIKVKRNVPNLKRVMENSPNLFSLYLRQTQKCYSLAVIITQEIPTTYLVSKKT